MHISVENDGKCYDNTGSPMLEKAMEHTSGCQRMCQSHWALLLEQGQTPQAVSSIWVYLKKRTEHVDSECPGNLFSNEKHMTFQMHDGLSAVMLVEPLINHWDFTPDVSWPIFWGWAPIRYNKHQKTCWHALNDIILNVLICGVLLWSGNRKICRNVVWEPTFFDPQLLGVASLDMYKYLLLRYACSDFSWYWST